MKKLNSLSSQSNHCPHLTHTLIPLCPNYWSFVTKDMLSYSRKISTGENYSSNGRTSRKQYVTSSHYRPRQCPVTLKINAQRVTRERHILVLQRAVLRLTWQSSTASKKELTFQFLSATVQTDTFISIKSLSIHL